MTADTIVQDSAGTPQTLNRYTYCNNNPVNLIDPSGHFWFIPAIIAAVKAITIASVIKGAIIGAVVGAATSAITGGNVGQGALMGAIGGAFFGAAGDIIKAGHFALGMSSVTHMIAGASSGAIGSAIQGGNIGQGALIGGLAAGAAKFAGAQFNLAGGSSANEFIKFSSTLVKQSIIGAAVGGVASVATGGNFGDGARMGAITAGIAFLANDSLHGDGFLNKYVKIDIDKFFNVVQDVLKSTGQNISNFYNDVNMELEQNQGLLIAIAPQVSILSSSIGVVSSLENVLFARVYGLLNSNDFVRIGKGWVGTRQSGQEVFRVGIGNKNMQIFGKKFHFHIDLWKE